MRVKNKNIVNHKNIVIGELADIVIKEVKKTLMRVKNKNIVNNENIKIDELDDNNE